MKKQKIKVQKSPGKGRGIFASKTIKKGEKIEVCELVLLPKSVRNIGRFQNYLFDYNRHNYAVALGLGSLYNHSRQPNATWSINDGRLLLRADRKIVKGKEITISYGYEKRSFIA